MGIVLGRPLVGPQVVSLEVTHHCNLRCSFCESHGSLQALPITARRSYEGGRRTMDLETIRRIAGEFARIGVDLVELSGKGDPIAHPRLADIVRILRGAGLRCSLVTNGTLATPDLVRGIVDSGVERLNVSLNSGTREVYAKVNGKDLWDRAIRFLSDVLDRRRAERRDRPWVRISQVVCRDNADSFDDMVRICCDLRVDETVWYVMGELPETTGLQITGEQAAAILERIPEWIDRFEEAGVRTDLAKFASELPLRAHSSGTQENPLQKKLPCYEGWMFCVIAPDGAVVPCCYCEEEVLGNVFDEPFDRIWWNARYRDLRRRMLEMPKTGRWICKECFTSCNRAVENKRIHDRVHPLGPRPSVPAPERTTAAQAG